MSKVIRYAPLDGMGEVRLDLHECPRLWLRDQRDFHNDMNRAAGLVSRWVLAGIYLTPELRWVAHHELAGIGRSFLSKVSAQAGYNAGCLFVEVSKADAVREMPCIQEYVSESKLEPIAPADETANTQTNSDEVWISFAEACEMTGLEPYQITRACDSNQIRSRGKGRGRVVHARDVSKFMTERRNRLA